MTNYAKVERDALCDLMEQVGPDSPTLCEGWQTRHLAAHVVLRDRRPDLSLGMALPPLAGRLERALQETASGDYVALLQQAREGSQPWNPVGGLLEATVNGVEFFIHHEDVRRAVPDWTPRQLSAEQQQSLWTQTGRAARLLLRQAPVGIVLVAPGHGRCKIAGPADAGTVVITGAPAELLLWVYGRRDHAVVELTGNPADVSALRSHQSRA